MPPVSATPLSPERGCGRALTRSRRGSRQGSRLASPLASPLASLLASLLASACGEAERAGVGAVRDPNTPNRSNSAPISLWHAYRGDERAALERAIERFEAREGRPVTLLALPYSAFPNKLQAASARGSGPDLFIFAHDRIGDWAEAGLIEPLGFWVSAEERARLLTPAVEALERAGNLYGLPLSCKTLALFYHRGLVSTPPATTAALWEAARGAREAARGRGLPLPWGLAAPELDSLYFHAPWLHAHGGDALDLEGRGEAAVASARYLRARVDEGLVPAEVNGALASELFRSGRLAFLVSGPWLRGDLAGFSEWGVAPLPTLSETGRPLAPYLGVEAVMMSSRARDPEGALALMRALAGDEEARVRLAEGQLVASRAAYEDPAALADPWLQAFRAQLERAAPMSGAPEMRAVWTPFKRALSSALVYGEPPEPAFEEARRALRARRLPPQEEVR